MNFDALAFTPMVKRLQERYGSRRAYARREAEAQGPARLGGDEIAFIEQRDSFYWATIGSTGWPNVQHRGGPPGFVTVADDQTLVVPDYRGNRQYVSTGNLLTNPRVALIFMDYPHQARLKLLATAQVVEGEAMAVWLPRLKASEGASIERAFVLHVEAFDWNCPRHITPRYTVAEIEAAMSGGNSKSEI